MEFAGMNAERYEALMNQLRLRGVNPAFPNGIVSNVVGFTKDGAYVVNVWDSKQLFEDFLVNRLTPALGAVGGLPQPRVTTFDVYKSYTVSPVGTVDRGRAVPSAGARWRGRAAGTRAPSPRSCSS